MEHLWRFALLAAVFVIHEATVHASFAITPAGDVLIQCEQLNLSWTETPPIHLWSAPDREVTPGDPVIIDFGIINASFLLWTNIFDAGQNVSFTYVQQSNVNNLFVSDLEYEVEAGTTTSCLPGENISASPHLSSTSSEGPTSPASINLASSPTASDPPTSLDTSQTMTYSAVTSSPSSSSSSVPPATSTNEAHRLRSFGSEWACTTAILLGCSVHW